MFSTLVPERQVRLQPIYGLNIAVSVGDEDVLADSVDGPGYISID
jgi:hypothetical protein